MLIGARAGVGGVVLGARIAAPPAIPPILPGRTPRPTARRHGGSGPGWLALTLSHTRIAAGIHVERRLIAGLRGMGHDGATQRVSSIRYVGESGDPVPWSVRLARPLHLFLHGDLIRCLLTAAASAGCVPPHDLAQVAKVRRDRRVLDRPGGGRSREMRANLSDLESIGTVSAPAMSAVPLSLRPRPCGTHIGASPDGTRRVAWGRVSAPAAGLRSFQAPDTPPAVR